MVTFFLEICFFQKWLAEFSRPRIWLPMSGWECDMQGWGSRVYSARGVVQEAILSSYHKFGSNGGNYLRFFKSIILPKTIIVPKLIHLVKLIHPVKKISCKKINNNNKDLARSKIRPVKKSCIKKKLFSIIL